MFLKDSELTQKAYYVTQQIILNSVKTSSKDARKILSLLMIYQSMKE